MFSLNRIRVIITIVAVSIYSVFIIISTNDKNERIELVMNQSVEVLERNLRVITQGYKNISNVLYNGIINDHEVLSLLYSAKHAKNEKELSLIRDKLYTHKKDHFKQLSKIGINVMQFVFEDNISFLRLHKPNKFGDSLTTVRYSVSYVNKNKVPIHGFEQGKVSHSFRNVFPIFFNNEYLGAIDIGFSSDSMQDTMLEVHKLETHLIINKNIFKSNVYRPDREVKYIQSIEHDDYLCTVTDGCPEEMNSREIRIDKYLKKEINKNINDSDNFSLYYHEGDFVYIISFFSIKNIKDQKKVAFLVSYSDSPYLENMLHQYVWLNIAAFMVLLILSTVIYNNRKQRILLQEEVKERTKDLEEEKITAQNATKAKSLFLANMSHEIRTPMNGIIGITYLLLQTKLNKKQQNYLEKIDESANSLLGIINSILDFSKIEAGKLSLDKHDFNLLRTITNIIGSIEFKAKEKRVAINLNYGSDLGSEFHGDKLRISQVLTNILSNAVKFTHDGEININVSSLGDDRIRFEVKDTGIGLSSKQQLKLFKSFSQADTSTTRKYGGTGLGLAISKQLVELMNGDIWVESKKNVGSNFIFEIELPKSNFKDNDVERTNLNIHSINALVDKKILVVEDNKTNQLVLLGLLEDSKLKIDIANNGEEAVDMFNRNSYDLILMDLQMPVMDGYTAAKIIRESNKDIPIIALSANAMKADINKTIEAGMNEHLTKPCDVKELFYTINKYIN